MCSNKKLSFALSFMGLFMAFTRYALPNQLYDIFYFQGTFYFGIALFAFSVLLIAKFNISTILFSASVILVFGIFTGVALQI